MIRSLVLAALILLIPGCAGKPIEYTRQPLRDKILRPYPGKVGLIEEACKRDEDGNCVYSFEEYDLNDRATRMRLRDAGFVCNVAGTVYRVAQEKAGLVLERHDQKCFLAFCGKSKEVEIDFIPITNTQRLLDARTVCFSHFSFDYDSK